MTKEAYILLQATIQPQSVGELSHVLEKLLQKEYKRIHLLMNSPGGSVRIAIAVYNFLKSLPFELFTYNLSCVDSSAILIFVAGQKRYSARYSRFLAHPVSKEFHFDQTLKSLQQESAEMQLDMADISSILADNTKLSAKQWRQKLDAGKHILEPETSAIGLTDGVCDLRLPQTNDFFVIS